MATRPETPRAQADKMARDAAPKTSELVGVDGWPDRKGVTTRIQEAVDKAYPGWTITLRVESRTPTRVVLIIDARNSAVPPPLLSAVQAEKLARLIDDTLEALVPRWDFTVAVARREPGHVQLFVDAKKGREGDPPVSADGDLFFDSERPKPTLSAGAIELASCKQPSGMDIVLKNPNNKVRLFVHFASAAPSNGALLPAAFIPTSQNGAAITVDAYPAPWSTAGATPPTWANVAGLPGPIPLSAGHTYVIKLPSNQDYVICVSGLGALKMWW